MGGCASKPKAIDDMKPEPLPNDVHVSPKNIDIDANQPAVEENNGGAKNDEAPLVDLPESKKPEGQEAASEPETAVAEPVSADSNTVTQKESTVETASAASPTTPVVVKEEIKEVTKPEAKLEKANEPEPKQQSVAEPTKVEENKNDAPLVTL